MSEVEGGLTVAEGGGYPGIGDGDVLRLALNAEVVHAALPSGYPGGPAANEGVQHYTPARAGEGAEKGHKRDGLDCGMITLRRIAVLSPGHRASFRLSHGSTYRLLI